MLHTRAIFYVTFIQVAFCSWDRNADPEGDLLHLRSYKPGLRLSDSLFPLSFHNTKERGSRRNEGGPSPSDRREIQPLEVHDLIYYEIFASAFSILSSLSFTLHSSCSSFHEILGPSMVLNECRLFLT